MTGYKSPQMPAEPKRKKRRGRRKSKTERLARATFVSVSPNASLHTLLSKRSSSCEWDAAQSLALQMGTLEARATVVRSLLNDHEAPRAAAHYAKRLHLQGKEVLSVLVSTSPLLVAQFIVELDESILKTRDRLEQFVWPWLLQSLESKPTKTVVKAAVHLMLHPPDSNEEKLERSKRLQRAIVTKCLESGKLCHLVPLYARAFATQLRIKATKVAAKLVEERKELASVDETLALRQQVAYRIQLLLSLLWPDVRVLPFGSSVTGLLPLFDANDQQTVDVDLCALLPSAAHFRHETAPLIHEIQEHFRLYLFQNDISNHDTIHAVLRARIPIVHFQDPMTALSCDLCVNNIAALWNTRLVRWLLYRSRDAHKMQHVRQLCRWLRTWRQRKERAVASAVTSYGLVLLAIYYLQRIGLLPCIDCSALVSENAATLQDLTENEIDNHLERIEKHFVKTQDNNDFYDWMALRRGFFRFYTCEFDYEHTVVSLRSSVIVSKTSKGWSLTPRLCLEDPVETERDLGALASRRAYSRLRCAFAQACVILNQEQEQESKSKIEVEKQLLTTWAYEQETNDEEGASHATVGSY